MAITTAMPTSFKVELLVATHNFTNATGDVFKIALYTSTATLGAATTAYSTTNEITGTGYTAGGNTLTTTTAVASTTAGVVTFSTTSWTTASFTANGAMIYNSSKANRACAIIAFGGDQTVAAATFTINFPTADASNAVIRLT